MSGNSSCSCLCIHTYPLKPSCVQNKHPPFTLSILHLRSMTSYPGIYRVTKLNKNSIKISYFRYYLSLKLRYFPKGIITVSFMTLNYTWNDRPAEAEGSITVYKQTSLLTRYSKVGFRKYSLRISPLKSLKNKQKLSTFQTYLK